MAVYTLPFRTNTPYSFTATCGGNNFKFHIKHAMSNDTYYMDIDIMRNNRYEPLIQCLAITCGCDLFIPFKQYSLGTFMVVPNDPRYYTQVPNADTIISKFLIYWEHD